jgi:hypothetical protein
VETELELQVPYKTELLDQTFWDVAPCGSYYNDFSEKRVSSTFKMERICEVGKTLAVNGRVNHSEKKHKSHTAPHTRI